MTGRALAMVQNKTGWARDLIRALDAKAALTALTEAIEQLAGYVDAIAEELETHGHRLPEVKTGRSGWVQDENIRRGPE